MGEPIKQGAGEPFRVTPTLLYNEGWMIKLVLRAAANGIDCLPFRFEPGSKWFSEVLLHSVFKPRFRGDCQAEGFTHADGVVGHYSFSGLTKAGMILDAACSQLVVCEAKMFSSLSPGTSRAKHFDQAARTVGCIAAAISQSKKSIESYKSIGFCILAPDSQIVAGVFSAEMTKAGIRSKLTERVAMYNGESEQAILEQWLQEWAFPVIERMELACCSWETILKEIVAVDPGYGASLRHGRKG